MRNFHESALLGSVALVALTASAPGCGGGGGGGGGGDGDPQSVDRCASAKTVEDPAIVGPGADAVWSDPAVWGGCLPGPETPVIIERGASVTLDIDACVDSLVIQGELVFAEQDLDFCARHIMVEGHLAIGTEERPFTHQAVVTLVGGDPDEDIAGMGSKFVGVHGAGVLDLHGTVPGTAWTTLEGAVAAGSKEILVAAAAGWKVGDSIVVASGSIDPDEAEVRTITSIDGTRLTLDEPLQHGRDGTLSTIEGRTVDTRAEIGNLTRNIVIQGDEASTNREFGGHVMIMAGGYAAVDGIVLRRMGQFDHGGRYPLHWHVAGDASGQYVRNSVVDGSIQRGIVVHSTQGVTVERNIVRDSNGHNFIVETPETTGNAFLDNLAVGNRIANFTDPVLVGQGDNEVANFWIRAANNTYHGNHAAGSSGSGFWYDAVSDTPTDFADNTAHSAASRGNGVFVRESGLLVVIASACDECAPPPPLELRDTTLYENSTSLWPSEGAQRYVGFTFVGPHLHSQVTAEASYDVDLVDPLFVSGVEAGVDTASPLLIQYASRVRLERPVFVDFHETSLIATNDILVPWQADIVVSGARLVGTSVEAAVLPDACVAQFLDDTYLPRGFYVRGDEALLAASGMAEFPAEDDVGYFFGPERMAYAEIMTRVEGELIEGPGRTVFRSDGLQYEDDFVEGFRVIYDGGLAYRFEAAPTAATFEVGLHRRGAVTQTSDVPSLQLAIPLEQAPNEVAVGLPSDLEYLSGGEQLPPLTQASSLTEIVDAPKERYFYDADAKLLYLQLTDSWLVVTR